MSSNRKDRRKANKAKPAYLRRQDNVKSIIQNGITLADLKRNYDEGYHNGFNEASSPVMRTCYAAALLAVIDLYGFGHKRCKDVLSRMDYHVVNTLASQEAIQEVFDRVGVKIVFYDPFERVQDK